MKSMIFLVVAGLAGTAASAQLVSTGAVGGTVGATVGTPAPRVNTNVNVRARATTDVSARAPEARVRTSARAPSTWTRGDAAWNDHMRTCYDRYDRYDPATDTYYDRDGIRRTCAY